MIPMTTLALAAAAFLTATVHVNLTAPAGLAEARGTLTLRATEGVGKDALVREVRVPGRLELEGSEGRYLAELHVPGVWLAPQVIHLRDGATVELAARPAGALTGTASTGGPVTIRFTDPADPSFTGQSVCATEEESFRCELPAGTFDLRIGRDGHVPHYRAHVPVHAGKSEGLGAIAFVPGAALSGRIEIEEGELGDVQLALVPASGKGTSTRIRPGRNGFFSAGPIAVGDYTLTAAQKGFISRPVPVTIREGLEATLREPLVLARPRRLSLLISPPADPLALGWTVTLRQLGPKQTTPHVVAEGAASLDGSWSAENLLPGRHEAIVRPKGGPVWRVEEIVIDDALTTRQLFVPSMRFEGTVRFGDKPLAAKLVFGGSHSESAIPWRSDDEGKFHGYMPLPDAKQWAVTVTSDLPPIDVTLSDVPMRIDEAAGVARVDIRLPVTTLEGLVVDEREQPVAHALVNVDPRSPGGRMTQVNSDEKGFFSVNALEPGRYRLTASDFMKESEAIDVELPDNAREPVSLRVQLREYRQWKGRVTTPNGQPVAGARVIAAAVDVPIVLAYPARSDAEGRFVLLVPSGAKLFDFMVAPRGFTYNYFRRAYSDDLRIVVHPNGGTLVIDLPEDRSVEAAVWHNGSVISAYTLLSGWLAELEQGAGGPRLRAPQMDPGSYTFCLVPAGTVAHAQPGPDCKFAYLAPYGETLVTWKAATAPRRGTD
jgi:hypothetical protein